MPVISAGLKKALSTFRVWALALTGLLGSTIYFEGESYQSAIDGAFHIPSGLTHLTASETFIIGVLTLLSHHIGHLIAVLLLFPLIIGITLMMRQSLKRTWKRTPPKWRLRMTDWGERIVARLRGWVVEPEFHFLTMPVITTVLIAMTFALMAASSTIISEGSKAGGEAAKRLKETATRCAIGQAYMDENPSCSVITLKTGKQIHGLLFTTSGSNLFISDGVRTKVVDLGSVDSISDIPGAVKRPPHRSR